VNVCGIVARMARSASVTRPGRTFSGYEDRPAIHRAEGMMPAGLEEVRRMRRPPPRRPRRPMIKPVLRVAVGRAKRRSDPSPSDAAHARRRRAARG